MYSKFLELVGLGLIAWGMAILLGTAAGLITGGLCLTFVGSVTDDAAVGLAVRRGIGWIRFHWHKQLLKETMQRKGSPHPPIHVDPESEEMARRLAEQRIRRGDGRMTEVLP